MSTLALDTHKAVKALQEAGADELLAEAVVATVGEAVGENVATKTDVAELKSEIAEVKSEIAEVKSELKSEIAEVKSELKSEIAEVKSEIAEVKSELKSEIAEVKSEIAEVKSELKSEIATLREDVAKSIHGVYKLMVVAILTITSTIIGTAIALVRYLAP